MKYCYQLTTGIVWKLDTKAKWSKQQSAGMNSTTLILEGKYTGYGVYPTSNYSFRASNIQFSPEMIITTWEE